MKRKFLLGHLRRNGIVAGSDHVAGQGEEPRRQAGLGQHPVLDLIEADSLVVPPPVPARDVQQVGLVVIVQELDDTPGVLTVALY